MSARPRLLVLNQYYWPGIEATAYLLTELCESLGRDWDVTVVCGTPRGARPGTHIRNGVRVIHVPSAAFEKRFMGLRVVNYLSFLLLAGLRGARARRPDVVLAMTDPPFIGAVAYAVARRFRSPFVLVTQDLFPETAAAVGRVRSAVVLAAIATLVGVGVRNADRVVAIGETMRRRLEKKGAPAARIRVIPNWVDPGAVRPMGRDNDWARERGLVGRFVVMHFGNLGFAHDLETLIRASTLLRDLDDLRVVIVGRGAREADLRALARGLGADDVVFVEHQPRAIASLCIASADVHAIGLTRGLAGYVVPSRLYGVLAARRPVIVGAEEESETARLVHEVECGLVVPPGDPPALAGAIRAFHAGHYDLDAMGGRGRDYVLRDASLAVAVSRYRDLLEEVRRSHS
ncbi:MAG: glycosyltransferase family 4 protein [Actinomycetota bacterium]|nr:glycosyltransferase family 4 protein [Actinomycetota bacterium]